VNNAERLGVFNSSKLRVCFLSKQSPARYKDLDAEILERHFNVTRVAYEYRLSAIVNFLSVARQSDVLVAWFANPWLACLRHFIPKRVKLVVIAGGYDVADCPELKYGARHSLLYRSLTRGLLEQADLVLPVSRFNEKELLGWVRPRRHRMIYNAVDFPDFELWGTVERKRKVVTVGAIQSFISLRKGHYRFLEVAKRLPDVEFLLIGKELDSTIKDLRAHAPENVRFSGFLTRQELLQEMLSASVYLQLSVHEAFGVSVAEALACGCFPIVARETALPEIIDSYGAVVVGDEIQAAVSAVSKALEETSYRGIDARIVRKKFSVAQRERKLSEAVEALFDD